MKPLYVIEKTHHWCKEYAAKAIDAKLFKIPNYDYLHSPTIKNLLQLLQAPFYAFALPKSEVYVCSDFSELLVIRLTGLWGKKGKIIHLLFSDYYSNRHSGIKKSLLMWAAKNVDTVIATGEFVAREVRRSQKCKIVNHFLKDDSCFSLHSDIQSKNILSIGMYGTEDNFRKGEDVFFEIARLSPKYTFTILGKKENLPKKMIEETKKIKNLTLPGYVDPKKHLEKSLIYLAPARYDAGPISVIEAMAAGLIPIVSANMGSADLVKKLREKFVVNSLDPKAYAKEIQEIMKLPTSEKIALSTKAKKIASEHSLKKGSKQLKQTFREVCK